MAKRDRLSGNEAIALAMKQINPDVMPAFPITPSTELPQFMSNYIANGQCDTEFIPVESEHSAMSAAIGAEAAGARTCTATSSAGLALMWEMLYVAASDRLPLVLACVNRAMSGPLNINCEHSDSMGARDAGWIQIYAENNQEAYDNFIQAYPIGEDPRVQLPVMICQDGFITSHAVENIVVEDDEMVKKFVGEYKPAHFLLNEKEPMAVGPYAVTQYGMEAKKAQAAAMERAEEVIMEVADKFEKATGRKYGFYEGYELEDAEYVIVCIGSAAGTVKDAIDELRAAGVKAGLLKVRVFRPFPAKVFAAALKNAKAVAIMDRAESYSACGGPLASELSAAMYTHKCTAEIDKIMYGLNGRDLTVSDVKDIYAGLEKLAKEGRPEDMPEYRYIGLREE